LLLASYFSKKFAGKIGAALSVSSSRMLINAPDHATETLLMKFIIFGIGDRLDPWLTAYSTNTFHQCYCPIP